MGWWKKFGLVIIHEEILQLRRLVMANQEELRTKLNDLQTALDTEQEQIKTSIDGLKTALEDMRNNPEIPQDIIDQIDSIRSDLAGTIPDAVEGGGEPTGEEPV